MNIYTLGSRSSSTSPKRRSSFASAVTASEFGGRYYGWREWANYQDIDPETLAEKRFRAIWGGAK